MSVIQNKWIEKEHQKKKAETAPAFESKKEDDWTPASVEKKVQRHTNAARATMRKTLRGVRK